jgi:periplasmic protein TonB
MLALRLPIAIALGGLFTTSMFWLLWTLVGAAVDVGDMAEATRIDFSRMRRDTEVQTKRDEKVERERPPPAPEMPRMAFNVGGVENNVAQLTPMLDARGAMSRMTMSAGSDRDVIPLVRIAPDYPPRALSRGLEGWVQVQFTITPTGQVKDPMVVNADPKNIFDDAALKAIARWRYNPKVEGGVAVERVGVQTIIRFQLEQ